MVNGEAAISALRSGSIKHLITDQIRVSRTRSAQRVERIGSKVYRIRK